VNYTFGAPTSLGSNASAISSLVLQSDGKIIAAGATFSIGNLEFQAQAAVARYLAQ
jgi:Mg2+/Co2+ transporter CorC